MTSLPRLRQVALVARDCGEATTALEETFGWPEPFHDPGVREFGLTNSVFAVGDTFLEVVSPVKPGTTAGRYLERRGADSGYMAIFQMPDLAEARQRVSDEAVRVVWSVDLDDIAGTHLHPKDTPGAIVSLDWATPAASWRWAGPAWTGGAPAHASGGISGVTIEVADPTGAAGRWGRVLGIAATSDGTDAATVRLDTAGQVLRFVRVAEGAAEGITEVWLDGGWPEADLVGVRFRSGRP